MGCIKRKNVLCLFCTSLLVSTSLNLAFSFGTSTTKTLQNTKSYEIINPYKSVDWNSYGQYKACLHMHTTESDGLQSPKEMIEDCYRKNYDIVAITDHDIINTTWDRTDMTPDVYLTPERLLEINTGTDRNGRKMIGIPFTVEQSVFDHVNTFWADFVNKPDATIESKIAKCEELGGISHINHPGGAAGSSLCFYEDQITYLGIEYVNEYTDLFFKYPSCVGIEVFNANYGNRLSFRHLWDHILMNTMPNRPVWAFSNDDAHFMTGLGYDFNIMLMPENNEENIRYSMENGTFYAVNASSIIETTDDPKTQGLYPVISNISVDQAANSITITATNYDVIEWIADVKTVATGNSIDLNNYENKINGYIRAKLKGTGGITFTQPFGIVDKSSTKIGDIDKNGQVNAIDFAMLRKHLLGICGCTLTTKQLKIADVDGNNILNAIDFAYMRLYLLGIISEF